jgi:hypothetical protein
MTVGDVKTSEASSSTHVFTLAITGGCFGHVSFIGVFSELAQGWAAG